MAELQRFEANLKKLGGLASFLGIKAPDKFEGISISGISSSSNRIVEGDLFVALPGKNSHGANFAESAKSSGAVALLTDEQGAEISAPLLGEFPVLIIKDPRFHIGYLADWFHNSPSHSLYLAGITGTNGKTTIAWLLKQIWDFAWMDSGVIGTIGIKIGQETFPATHTTPEADQLHNILSIMQERHLKAVAMEVSSHALSQNRVDGATFATAAFTNLTQDHLDFHGSMENYYQAKKKLFNPERCQSACINIDDAYGSRLVGELAIAPTTVSRESRKAHWYYEDIKPTTKGFEVSVRGKGGILISGRLDLIGEHNLDNALMAIAIAFESGVDPLVIGNCLGLLKAAPGRLESIYCGQDFTALVDYAHTPDAVEKVLSTLRKVTDKKIIAILGSGGDRDKTKRPLMGQALYKGSDIAIFTTDNPRNEDPLEILSQMQASLEIKSPSAVIADRSAAIMYGVERAESGDILVVLGKGHESGQEIKGVKVPFSDQDVLRKAIEAKL